MKSGWTLAIAATLLVCASTPRVYAQAPPPEEPQAAPEGEPALGDEEAMVLNFERADIREVIHSLATALGLSYTIDPRIEGQVTIRTTGKIPREDLFPLFNQILRNNGIAAVKVGNVYQILPVAEAKTRAIIPKAAAAAQSLKATDSFVIEIMPLHHVTADEMVNILQPFLTPGGDALSYPRANLVVMTDLASNVDRLRDLVKTFDADAFANQHARVFKMKFGDPDEIANEMLGLLAPYGITPTGDGEGGLFMVPLTRLNAIVVIAFDPAVFSEVERWLKVLDIPPDEESGRQTFVYSVENAKAGDLAAVLNELFGGGPGGGGGGLGRQPGAAPGGVGLFGAGGVAGRGGAGGGGLGNRRGGGLGGGGGGGIGGAGGAPGTAGAQAAGSAAAGGRQLGGGAGGGGRGLGRAGGTGGVVGGAPGAPGAPGQAGGGAHGVSLPGGPAGGGMPGQQQGPPPVFKQEVRIVADDVTNSLVILATKRDYQFILDILRRIDVVPRQVVLEVTIAEITLNKDLEFGIAYALAEHKLGAALPQDTTGSGDGLLRNRGVGDVGQNVGGLIGTATKLPIQGAFGIITDRQNFQIFINALQRRTNVKMLSAPHIIAADNREAHILVGQSIPILTSTQQSLQSVNASVVNSVQYRDTGKILTILPQVNSKGLVNMQVRQEVSAVLAGGASFGQTNSPAFSTRETETTVVVQDGDTVLIGGIIDDSLSTVRAGVPYLMDVPFLGRFFRRDTDTIDRTELLVTITPYVVRGRDDALSVTDDFTARIEGMNRMRDAMHARRTKRPMEPEPAIEPPVKAPVPR